MKSKRSSLSRSPAQLRRKARRAADRDAAGKAAEAAMEKAAENADDDKKNAEEAAMAKSKYTACAFRKALAGGETMASTSRWVYLAPASADFSPLGSLGAISSPWNGGGSSAVVPLRPPRSRRLFLPMTAG